MTATTPTARRKYRRLTSEQLATINSEWASGAFTYEDLAARHDVSTRTIAGHLSKSGVKKGSSFDDAARREIEEKVLASVYAEATDRLERAEISKRQTFETAVAIESALKATATLLAKDTASASRHIPALRAIDLATSALDRLFKIKCLSLGVRPEDLPQDELPQIIVRDLTEDDLAEIRRGHAAAYGYELDEYEPASSPQ